MYGPWPSHTLPALFNQCSLEAATFADFLLPQQVKHPLASDSHLSVNTEAQILPLS